MFVVCLCMLSVFSKTKDIIFILKFDNMGGGFQDFS